MLFRVGPDGSGFNPTLVRLRLEEGAEWVGESRRFQSHAGSIEAGCVPPPPRRFRSAFQSHAGSIEAKALSGLRNLLGKFQSHAGSIEAPIGRRSSAALLMVSIPRWFD